MREVNQSNEDAGLGGDTLEDMVRERAEAELSEEVDGLSRQRAI